MIMVTKKHAGFTIVELLIVIVVIAILAAITVVAYNGIQTRGKNASSFSTASMVTKKAVLYNTEIGYYPLGWSSLTGAPSTAVYSVSGIIAQSLTDSSPTNAIGFYVCGSGSPASAAAITASNVTGGRIYYRDYQNSTNKNTVFGSDSGTGIACFSSN